MRIQKLRKIPGTRTWTWRTVEGNTGTYMTYDNGKGILFNDDAATYGTKFCTWEKFSVCKTPSGTRKKLNRLFSTLTEDPSRGNDYRL